MLFVCFRWDWKKQDTISFFFSSLLFSSLLFSSLFLFSFFSRRYGAWASTTGDRRFDQRGRVGKSHFNIFPSLKVLNLSKNDIDDWRQVWRLAWLPNLERLMLNENKIDKVEFLGNWGNELDESFRQSEIPEWVFLFFIFQIFLFLSFFLLSLYIGS